MNQKTNLVRFNQEMDELVANLISNNLGTPEFRTEYVKATNLYKRVAEYDVELASELLPNTMMFAYTFAVGIVNKVAER